MGNAMTLEDAIDYCQKNIPDSIYEGREKIIKRTGDQVLQTFQILPRIAVFSAHIFSEKAYFMLFPEGDMFVHEEYGGGRGFKKDKVKEACDSFLHAACFNSHESDEDIEDN